MSVPTSSPPSTVSAHRDDAASSRLDRWLDTLGLTSLNDDKPRVGVSACLMGRLVRYNGEAKRHGTVADVLPRWLHCIEYCPEVAIGLPVPRPPVDVIVTDAGQQIRNRDGLVDDITEALHAYADGLDGHSLDGMILKARSPSCGLGNTPLLDQDGQQIGTTDGGFAGRLRTRWPTMPMVHEEQLARAIDIEIFVLRVCLYRQQCRWDNDAWRGEMRERIMALPLADLREQLLQQLAATP